MLLHPPRDDDEKLKKMGAREAAPKEGGNVHRGQHTAMRSPRWSLPALKISPLDFG